MSSAFTTAQTNCFRNLRPTFPYGIPLLSNNLGGPMKFFVALLALVSTTALAGTTPCSDPLRNQDVCYKMQYLRAQVNALDAQRELMEVNYGYLATLGYGLKTSAESVMNKVDLPEHKIGLEKVAEMGDALLGYASDDDGHALVIANQVRNACVTCHAPAGNPASGIKWGDVFAVDWNQIAQRCNEAGRNPYLCKSMNAMLTTFGALQTSWAAGVRDFEMVKYSADEVARVLRELKRRKVLHLPERFRADAEATAQEIANLAAQRDPSVFERALMLPASCVRCHEQAGSGPGSVEIAEPQRLLLRPASWLKMSAR